MEGQVFLDEAITILPHRLYDCGGFPGLVYDPSGYRVKGELWEVDEQGMSRLDVLEGVSEGEYVRGAMVISPGNMEVVVYYYLRRVEGLPEVGDEWAVA
jgi:gamma-glutamylcyclotransferase (GGCT)/AIG2-like uncharacterized protein YtfP